MFAKIFEQIFDSSIAEDYNCRRMFIDLLVLADPDGVVDMTPEAISRRTNVPMDEVKRYIQELQQPDSRSRSSLEEGKRLVKISDERDWGWQIVNYEHYRRIKDEESRRSYFREAQRKRREKLKKGSKGGVKDKVLTDIDKNGQVLTPASASSSLLKEGLREKFEEWMTVRKGMGKAPKNWNKMFTEQVKWLNGFSKRDQLEILSQSIRNNWQGLHEPKGKSHAPQPYKEQGSKNWDAHFKQPAPTGPAYDKVPPARIPTEEEIAKSQKIMREASDKLRKQFKMP